MQYMTTAQIRQAFLEYFEDKGCEHLPSSSLIPDDPSLLLTSAGMVQFKPYFLQQKHLSAPYIGATTVQKCVRTNDIDIIGTTGRHLSFFEMLGNFSFGAYFKQEACSWAMDFSVNVLGLPKERLYFTVYKDDDETIDIWRSLGVPASHITRLGDEDNFWRAGPTGPCGPCSELYFDQGEEFGCGRPDCSPGCDCDRFLEYWNLVFTQYDAQEDGTMLDLPKKNIDTGMGLERMAAIMQGVQTNYETDVLRSLIAVGEKLSGKKYGDSMTGARAGHGGVTDTDLDLRIIADHSRAVAFMIADGILPSNEGRGYVLRRLLRRAIMRAHMLGIEGPFLNTYVDEIVRLMGDVYPELIENRELERQLILAEEQRFGATLRQGRAYLEDALSKVREAGDGSAQKILPGEVAFTLHDTYGFPFEITREIAQGEGIDVDEAEFEARMDEQRARARAAGADDASSAWSTYGGVYSDILDAVGPTKFVGYTQLSTPATVLAIVRSGRQVESLEAGDSGEIVLDCTPFYAEMGGEVGDTGQLAAQDASGAKGDFRADVSDTVQPEAGLHLHKVEVASGSVRVGDRIIATVDGKRRRAVERNHSATHILHASLRAVLGDHVRQAGSYVAPDRLRFDFTHFEAVTPSQLRDVENMANGYILEAHPLRTYETSLEEARESGVTALFGEKYGDKVRVVDAGQFSRELCGGCHVRNTAEIGFVKIVSESSVGANLRRIEAVTGAGALAYVNRMEDELKAAAATLKAALFEVAKRTAASQERIKELSYRERKSAKETSGDAVEKVLEKAAVADSGYAVVISRVAASSAGDLRQIWDVLRAKMASREGADAGVAAVLAADIEGKAALLAAGTEDAVAAGFDAGALIREMAPIVGGGGGGHPAMAQAGGKNAGQIDAALDFARGKLIRDN